MLQTKRWATVAAAVVSIGWPGVCAAATLNVPGDFATIQACIDAAVSGVDECVVAPGTYHGTINFLGKAITMRSSGGAAVTRIDATGLGGSVVTCRSGEIQETVLNGFTISGGTGTDLDLIGNGRTYGGGMLNYYSSPTVNNCIFSGNTTTYYGGGMYNVGSSATVTNCTFNGNTVTYFGGAMYNDGGSPTITNCTFRENTATHSDSGSGGGMYNSYSHPMVTHCTFSGNRANDGGGMANHAFSPTITNCTFSGNTATHSVLGSGGAMYNDGGSPRITNCNFSGNTAYGGGGMANHSSSPKVTNCTFNGNTAIYSGGGMDNGRGAPTITNCNFSGNTAYDGGGMANYLSSPTVTNCTFSGNTAYGGGGIDNSGSGSGSSPTVTNCILWGDRPNEIVNRYNSITTVRFSDVRRGLPSGTINGGGNIDLDPMFVHPPNPGPDGTWGGVDDDYGDLRLRAGSPCIDAGDPAFVAQPGETDFEGHARVLCERVDMGAYESGIGDYDCDQTVDLTDFANWSSCMTGPHGGPYEAGCEGFDFDGDGDVDLLDFGGFQRIVGP